MLTHIVTSFLICMLYILTYVFLGRYFTIGVSKVHNDQGSIPLGKTMLKAPSIEFVTPKQIKQSSLDFLLGFWLWVSKYCLVHDLGANFLITISL